MNNYKFPKHQGKQNNSLTRRRWLKYAGLSVGAMTVSLIGKGLWDNFSTSTENSLHELDIASSSSSSSGILNQSTLSEYQFEVVTVNDKGEEIEREQGRAKYFTEYLGNGVTLEMVEIPSGTFMMGSPENEKSRIKDESPQHQVTVSSFYMGKYQVTQKQWQVIMENENKPSYYQYYPLNPVESVWLESAVEFCEKLSQATGKEYKLPSEAQWEYACRAGTTTPFHFGETITSDLANFRCSYTYANESEGEYRQITTQVGSFFPNAFGLYDMHGNVWEWCEDKYHSYQDAPNDGSAYLLEDNYSSYGNNCVIRGNSWFSEPDLCRSAHRYSTIRPYQDLNIGFRIVCVAPRNT